MHSNRLRDLIKNQDQALSFEEYRLRYAAERFLMRIQASHYRNKLVLKGGFLIGAIYEVNHRTTRDFDSLVMGIISNRTTVEKMLNEIIAIDLGDSVRFSVLDLQETQQHRRYYGFRAKLQMNFIDEKTFIQFDWDLGVGDAITPTPKLLEISLMFTENTTSEDKISLYSYPLETILAEKSEIILTLGTTNSRIKDFYDIFLILNDPHKPSLSKSYHAFENTWNFRHPQQPIVPELFEDWFFIIDELSENKRLAEVVWPNYVRTRDYAKSLTLAEILQQFREFIGHLKEEFQNKRL